MASGPWSRWWRHRPRAKSAKKKGGKLPPDRRLLLPMGVLPPKRGKEWRAARTECNARNAEKRCGVCNGPLPRPQVDHIIPELFLFQHGLLNVHALENLIAIHARCHGRKKTVEDLLFRGDKLGFLSGLRCLGWPMERVEAALKFYGL